MALCQARGFWGWRRHDWSSHLDPTYYRSMRYRTLKTRAKLLDKLRRRSSFEWDTVRRPFMAQNYVRWASHVSPRPGWRGRVSETESDTDKTVDHDEGTSQRPDDPLELSQREKRWKEHMDAMRQRIDQDPYQAVFGKRFEPFWSPLIPSWMKEELGLRKTTSIPSSRPSSDSHDAKSNPSKTVRKEQSTQASPSKSDLGPASGKSYAYTSSTSWDSWSNKTRRSEWDSITRKTKKYEYDPVSNRMVPVGEPSDQLNGADVSEALNPASTIRNPPPGALLSLAEATPPKSKQLSSRPPRPAALAHLPKNDLDLLTADDVRAKMGKTKTATATTTTTADRSAMQADFEKQSQAFDQEMNTLLKEKPVISNIRRTPESDALDTAMDTLSKERAPSLEPAINRLTSRPSERAIDPDDSAAHESTEPFDTAQSVPRDWSQQADLLQTARVQRTSPKVPFAPTNTASDLDAKADTLTLEPASQDTRHAQASAYESQLSMRADTLTSERLSHPEANHQTSPLDAHADTLEVERAHGRTFDQAEQASLNSKMDTLKTDLARMKEREAIHEAELAARANTLRVEKQRHEDTSALLRREISEQKSRLSSYEKRYAHKIQALRQELETAYKQSSKHADAHVDRIRNLESEVIKAQKANGPSRAVNEDLLLLMQGEGDVSTNIAQFANSSKWYKQPAPAMIPFGEQRAAQRARDQALVKEVREIYEKEYGTIDMKHRQSIKKPANAENIARDQALTKHEKESGLRYAFKADGLEAELDRQPSKEPSPEHSTSYQSSIEATTEPAAPSTTVKSSEPAVQWEEPPVYKVLAYDSGNDLFSTATTTSNFTPSEQPISIPQAFAQLYQPARFVSHFAELQKEGFQVIYGTRDLLVFKKVKSSAASDVEKLSVTDGASDDRFQLADHGLIKPMENALAEEAAMYYDHHKSARKEYDPTSIENGTLMPKENALAQEAANHYEKYRSAVNPVDGMTRSDAYPRPSTGNFASPTGFVNHDPVLSPEEKEALRQRETTERETTEPEGAGHGNYPKVRREEPVFSGSSRSRVGWARRHLKEERRRAREENRRGAGVLKWALSVGLTSAAMCYLIGLSAEMARQENRDGKERWQKIIDGKQNRRE